LHDFLLGRLNDAWTDLECPDLTGETTPGGMPNSAGDVADQVVADAESSFGDDCPA
jgi:hypothetical protein